MFFFFFVECEIFPPKIIHFLLKNNIFQSMQRVLQVQYIKYLNSFENSGEKNSQVGSRDEIFHVKFHVK
jgi:hypothetical protein